MALQHLHHLVVVAVVAGTAQSSFRAHQACLLGRCLYFSKAIIAVDVRFAMQPDSQTCLQVRQHMMSLLGEAALLPPTASLKMSKLQMVQVYGASVMFGYFLRRADSRFQLAKKTGMLPEDREEAVARLERLFALVRSAGFASTPRMSLSNMRNGEDQCVPRRLISAGK